MEIKNIKLEDLKPYEKNPRKNDEAVQYVAESIKQFGFKVPIIIDKNNVIVAGDTRYKASKQLGLKEVPCIVADDLTDEQIKAFRLADNKVSEKSEWDFELLDEELKDIIDIDMEDLGFINFDDIDAESYIDDLLETELVEKNKSNEFAITFSFNNEYKEIVDNYINENGKDTLAQLILDKCKGEI